LFLLFFLFVLLANDAHFDFDPNRHVVDQQKAKRRNKKKIDGSQPGSLVSLGTQESKDQHAIPSVNRDFILQENASL